MASQVCPICNGLVIIRQLCSLCGRAMVEIGRMEDYKGPYSTYMDEESFTVDNGLLLIGDPYCIHIYYCDVCNGIEYKTAIPKLI